MATAGQQAGNSGLEQVGRDRRALKRRQQELAEAAGKEVRLTSGVSGRGVREVLFALLREIAAAEEAEELAQEQREAGNDAF